MGTYTRMTRAWLDERYQRVNEDGVYIAHQPIYGLGTKAAEPDHFGRLARTFQILKILNGLEFQSFLDVGAGEGYFGDLVRRLFGAEVLVSDLSVQAGLRARDLFDLDAVALDSCRLPFRDDAFDIVLCSEVIEHVEFPVEVLLELARVARCALIVTTEEVTTDWADIEHHERERRDLPHAERNLFHATEIEAVLGPRLEFVAQYRGEAPADQEGDLTQAREWILQATHDVPVDPGSVGLILVRPFEREVRPETLHPESHLLETILAPTHAEVALVRREVSADRAPFSWEGRIVCPMCRTGLTSEQEALSCDSCSRSYPVDQGIPALFDENARDPDPNELASRIPEERRDAALRLRSRVTLPGPSSQKVWDFKKEADRERWFLGEQLTSEGASHHFRSTGSDPWLISPMLSLSSELDPRVKLTMRIHNPEYSRDAAVGQLFWMGEGDLSFSEENLITFPVINDDVLHTYEVELAGHSSWPQRGAVWLRLDPVNGPGLIELVEVRLSI